MSQSLKTKTNEELIKLLADIAQELEWRRQANVAANGGVSTQDETEEGGDHPPVSKFP